MNRTATADSAVEDHATIETLFERHADQVWNHAYRLTGTWDQAEDLVVATFAKACSSDVRLVGDSALPWLFATAGTIARSRYRRKEPVPDEDLRTRRIAEAVRALPRSERKIAELCLLGDVTVADAADVLGLTEVGARTRLSRAESRLRTALEEDR